MERNESSRPGEYDPASQEERLDQTLADIQRGREPHARLETQLLLTGLLPRLEQAGIVPVIESPNPYEFGDDAVKHEQWWENHPAEVEQFLEGVEKRDEVFRILYVGALIGSGPWEIP